VRGMQIFLIEDDTIYSEFIKKMLGQNAGYKITAFETAEAAQAALNGTMPDVMIIDYKLPGMSGIEFFEHIKSRLKNENRVIMLSAIDDGNMVLSFIQKGVRDYVIKDENVIDSLRAVLEGSEDDSYLFN
jgi:DNA-binding NarL/FixJ family response regulator